MGYGADLGRFETKIKRIKTMPEFGHDQKDQIDMQNELERRSKRKPRLSIGEIFLCIVLFLVVFYAICKFLLPMLNGL